jgi:hypothetical protein
MKKNTKPAAPANEPLDPLSAEGVTAMKQVTVQPIGIFLAPQDLDALLGIIRAYATEIERLKSAK